MFPFEFQLSREARNAINKQAPALVEALGVKDIEAYEARSLDAAKKAYRSIGKELTPLKRKLDSATGNEVSDIRHAIDGVLDMHETLKNEIFEGSVSDEDRGSNGNRPGSEEVRVSLATGEEIGPARRADDGLFDETRSLREFAIERGAEAFEGVGVGDFIRAAITGAKNEAEHRAIGGGSGAAGAFTLPTVLQGEWIDNMRPLSVAFQAGAMVTDVGARDVQIATLAGDPIPAFRGEHISIAESDPVFGQKTASAKSIGVMFKVSREWLDDTLNGRVMIEDAINGAMAKAVDGAILAGDGTGSNPTGILSATGVIEQDHGATTLGSYSPFVTANTTLRTNNAHEGARSVIASPGDMGMVDLFEDSTGQPLQIPRVLQDTQWLSTTGLADGSVIVGDLRSVVMAQRSPLEIRRLSERYADTNEVGVFALQRFDVVVTQPKKLLKIINVTQA